MNFPILFEGVEYATLQETLKAVEIMENSQCIKEYRSGVALLKNAAKDGCPHANYLMGRICQHCLTDTGVFISVSKAKSYYQVSAVQGHPFGIKAYEENKQGWSYTSIFLVLALIVGLIYVSIKVIN